MYMYMYMYIYMLVYSYIHYIHCGIKYTQTCMRMNDVHMYMYMYIYMCTSVFLISLYGAPLAQRAFNLALHGSLFGPVAQLIMIILSLTTITLC